MGGRTTRPRRPRVYPLFRRLGQSDTPGAVDGTSATARRSRFLAVDFLKGSSPCLITLHRHLQKANRWLEWRAPFPRDNPCPPPSTFPPPGKPGIRISLIFLPMRL